MNRRDVMKRLMRPLLLAGLLAFCGLTPVSAGIDWNNVFNTLKTVKQAVKPADLHEEEQIGYATAATLLGAAKPIDNADVQRYVNRVGLWVALQSERPDLPWHFAVVASDDIDAFAAPGGYVFITRGLLLHMRSEAELAGVLGHEITHVVMKDHLKALQRAAKQQLLGQALNYELQQHGKNTEVFNKIANATRTLYSRGLDKADEFQADRMGVVLATRAGYDPYGLMAVLQTLESIDPKSGRMQLLLATHPTPAARIVLLAAAMQAGHMDQYGNQVEGRERFLQVVKKLVPASGTQPAH
ncbi:MAG: M48 family metalloprotease [Gammaproteobacteria bacterium]|nr:M48 family metalloprotease [Gammaproteobacteria bacterium]